MLNELKSILELYDDFIKVAGPKDKKERKMTTIDDNKHYDNQYI